MAGRNERGAMGLGGLLFLLVLAALCYSGYKFLPPLVGNFQFDNDVQQEARMAVYNADTDDQIRAKLLAEAQALNLPVTGDDIVIQREGPDVLIAVQYDVVVAYAGHTVPMHFKDGAKGLLATQE
ncbi:MAG TPA: hypothetical protein VE996_03480 [Terriglobales bacterium]|nr:hypothetical protein [Terriglobales bacterium]